MATDKKSSSVFEGLPNNLPKPPEAPKVLPPELEGKTSEEIFTILKSEHERILAEQEQSLKPPPAAPPQERRYVPPPPPPPEQPGLPDPVMDPQGYAAALADMTAARLQPAVQQVLSSQEQVARGELARTNPEEYALYKDEIEQLMQTVHPQLRANPESWKTALRFVRANHIDEITDTKAKKLARETLKELGAKMPDELNEEQPRKPSNLFGSRSAPVTMTPKVRPPGGGVRLSDEEARVKQKLFPEMTDAEWFEWKKLNTDIGGMIP